MVNMKKDAVREHRIEEGIAAGEADMYGEDTVWSRYSHDKVDIAEMLMEVLRTLHRELPLSRPLRAMSVGSGFEPQFNILESAFRGGLYLLDVDRVPLEVIEKRLDRQKIEHVSTVQADYNRILVTPELSEHFLGTELGGMKLDLLTLHHSLYYCEEKVWQGFFEGMYGKLLARRGAIHAVMMASNTGDKNTTTWLYNHFAGKFFGCRNDQDLRSFGQELEKGGKLPGARFFRRRHRVPFFVDNFRRFMSVVWMILLYPNVHDYTEAQRREITEHVYDRFWVGRKPLIQMQDHLVVYKGL